jgi:hypothetical protein
MINGQESRRAALGSALDKLPLRAGANAGDALDLLQLGLSMTALNELPRMKSTKKKNGVALELKEFEKLATKLRLHLNRMSRKAVNSLARKDERHALSVDSDLKRMIERAMEAYSATQPTKASTSPQRLRPAQAAQLCAQIYEDLTARPATLHWDGIKEKQTGPYLRFIEEVFAICQINGSPEHYAREAERHTGPIGGHGGVTIRRVEKRP